MQSTMILWHEGIMWKDGISHVTGYGLAQIDLTSPALRDTIHARTPPCPAKAARCVSSNDSNSAVVFERFQFRSKPKKPPPIPSSRLLNLPSAVLDHILSHVYPDLATLRVVSLSHWAEKQLSRPDPALTSLKPTLGVEQLLVSKAYFPHAAKAYIGNQTFDQPQETSTNSFNQLDLASGALQQWIRVLKVEAKYAHFLTGFASLKDLTVEVRWWTFSNDQEPFVWKTNISDRALMGLHLFEQVRRVSGLERFALVVHGEEVEVYEPPQGDPRKLETWKERKTRQWRNWQAMKTLKRNVARLEELLGELVKRSWDAEAFAARYDFPPREGPLPLYANSRVCFGTSRLRPDPFQVREVRDEEFLYEVHAEVEGEEEGFEI